MASINSFDLHTVCHRVTRPFCDAVLRPRAAHVKARQENALASLEPKLSVVRRRGIFFPPNADGLCLVRPILQQSCIFRCGTGGNTAASRRRDSWGRLSCLCIFFRIQPRTVLLVRPLHRALAHSCSLLSLLLKLPAVSRCDHFSTRR